MDVSAEVRELKLPSAARVTLTTHDDPTEPGVNVEPVSVHTPDTLSHVSAPVPEPPEADSVNGSPYVASVVGMVSDDCDARETEIENEGEVTDS